MWINAAILFGLSALAIPVVVHLLMRGRPRRMVFPALRFVAESHQASVGRLRLKRVLLLALRMAILGLFVLILARPVARHESVLAAGDVPTAAIFCFDNSPSMQYRQLGQTRLESAKELALRIYDRLPPRSRAAVLDLHGPSAAAALQSDAGAVRDQVRRLEPTNLARPLSGMLRAAEGLLSPAPELRREIYLFTDLTETAWQDLGAGAMAEYGGAAVYVLDVGSDENLNVALQEPALSSRLASRNAVVTVSSALVNSCRATRRTVGFEIDGQMRGRTEIVLDRPAEIKPVVFDETFADLGLRQGRLMLLEEDPLAVDNVRYFTLQVVRPPLVAVVRSDQAEEGQGAAYLVSQALSPEGLRARGKAAVMVTLLPASAISRPRLKGFEAVYLVDAAGLSDEHWSALEEFVAGGGGLVALPGPRVAEELRSGRSSYAGPAARRALGVKLDAPVDAPGGAAHFQVPSYEHPALAAFERGQNGDVSRPTISRYFKLQPEPAAKAVLVFGGSDNDKGTSPAAPPGSSSGTPPPASSDLPPALVAFNIGGGTSFTLATVPQRPWSNLAGQAEFVILLHSLLGAARHESGDLAASGQRHGFALGEPITYAFPRALGGLTATLDGPGLAAPVSRPISAATGTATFAPLDQPGNFRLRVEAPDGVRQFGFSLNIDPAESRFERRSPENLRKVFAPGLLQVARDLPGLQQAETLLRRGQEEAWWLLPILMCAMILELFVAGRFQRLGRPAAKAAKQSPGP